VLQRERIDVRPAVLDADPHRDEDEREIVREWVTRDRPQDPEAGDAGGEDEEPRQRDDRELLFSRAPRGEPACAVPGRCTRTGGG
jgi:hypothetical protein